MVTAPNFIHKMNSGKPIIIVNNMEYIFIVQNIKQ